MVAVSTAGSYWGLGWHFLLYIYNNKHSFARLQAEFLASLSSQVYLLVKFIVWLDQICGSLRRLNLTGLDWHQGDVPQMQCERLHFRDLICTRYVLDMKILPQRTVGMMRHLWVVCCKTVSMNAKVVTQRPLYGHSFINNKSRFAGWSGAYSRLCAHHHSPRMLLIVTDNPTIQWSAGDAIYHDSHLFPNAGENISIFHYGFTVTFLRFQLRNGGGNGSVFQLKRWWLLSNHCKNGKLGL